MALTYGFYNSVKGDRKYDAMQFSEIIDTLIIDGIIPSKGQLFAVTTAENGMQINVGTGFAWFFHSWTKHDSVLVLTVEESDITRPRIDAVVLEVNREDAVRANSIKIVKGVAAVNAEKPTLVYTDKVHQYPLAYITVPAAAEEIKAENIENAVGLTPTVFATGVLETAPLDDLWSQWEGEWDTWFAAIKLQLSGDIVTNLQYQIDELREKVEDLNYELEKTELVSRNLAKISIKITDENGDPVKNVFIPGVKKDYTSTEIVYSDANGVIDGYATAGTLSTSIGNFLDVYAPGTTNSISAGEKYNFHVECTRRSSLMILATNTYYCSGYYLNADISLCGGGGGGGGYKPLKQSDGEYWDCHGGGGGGGYVIKENNINLSVKTPYQAVIGTGGRGGAHYSGGSESTNGTSGGSTSMLGKTASGGSGGSVVAGGSGNGTGGSGAKVLKYNYSFNIGASNGSPGSGTIYTSSSAEALCGGGGGGAGVVPYGAGSGETTNGASAAGGSPSGGGGGKNGASYGGGGGGASKYSNASYSPGTNGGSGGNGAIGIRLHN